MPLVLPGQEVRKNEPGRAFDRHHHLEAYAALVVSGSCHEAGDRGRFTAVAGDVLIHRAFDGHGDRIGRTGAVFINLGLDDLPSYPSGCVADLDAVVRAFERSPEDGRDEFKQQLRPRYQSGSDWPDRLAEDLAARRVRSLAEWSDGHGLHPASVSRGFRMAYGLSPKRYRLEQMASRAARRIRLGSDSLSGIAADCGFADQAHMTRTLTAAFALSPAALRDFR